MRALSKKLIVVVLLSVLIVSTSSRGASVQWSVVEQTRQLSFSEMEAIEGGWFWAALKKIAVRISECIAIEGGKYAFQQLVPEYDGLDDGTDTCVAAYTLVVGKEGTTYVPSACPSPNTDVTVTAYNTGTCSDCND
jgi:hypothetical protein